MHNTVASESIADRDASNPTVGHFHPARNRRSLRGQVAHTIECVTVVCMAQVDRLSITMAPQIGAAVRDAAAREGTSVSTWLTEAAAQRLRNDLLGVALDQWEAEDGPFSEDELNAAAQALRGPRRRRGAA
jgi:hypothetical protein